MRAPNEDLDDFKSNVHPAQPVPPPRTVTLRPSGDIEELKPLARYEDFVKSDRVTDGSSFHRMLDRLSWFHRSFAVLAAAAVVALFVVGSFFTPIYGPSVEPTEIAVDSTDIASNGMTDDILAPPEGLFDSSSLQAEEQTQTDQTDTVRSLRRASSARARVVYSAYRPRHFVKRQQRVVSPFVPTTLVIFAENGEIKTRIEPQLTAAYKKAFSLPN